MNVGDATLTFIADTAQLDRSIDKINSETPAKLEPSRKAVQGLGNDLTDTGGKGAVAAETLGDAWVRVARATKENSNAQVQLQQALKVVKESGDQDVVAMLALAEAQKRASAASIELAAAQRLAASGTELTRKEMKDATGTFAVGGEMIGIQLPRHIRSWLASMSGVSSVMSAAFSAVAIIFLIQILAEGIEKLEEWRKSGERLREEWIAIEAEFANTSRSIQHEIDQQEQKFIELTQGPVAALDFALKHLSSTAEQTFGRINAELDKSAQQMEKQKHFWNFWGDAGDDLKKFGANLTEVMLQAEKNSPQDPTAAYRAGLRLADQEIEETKKKIEELKAAQDAALESPGEGTGFAFDIAPLEKKLDLLQKINQQLVKGQELDDRQRQAAAEQEAAAQRQHTLEIGTAEINAEKSIALERIALRDETNKVLYAHGLISYAQELQSLKESETGKYNQERQALQQRLELLKEDPTKNEAAIKEVNGQLQAAAIEHKVAMIKIDEEEYKQRAKEFTQFMQIAISETKEGTQERLDLEIGLGEFLKQTWGEQSDEYIAQVLKIEAARRSLTEVNKQLAQIDRKNEEALLAEQKNGVLAYYDYLAQTARISAATLRGITQDETNKEIQFKLEALRQQLDKLGPEEVAARRQVLGQIAVLEEQARNQQKLQAAQAADVQELYYKQLGVASATSYERQKALAEDAYAHILLSGKATYAELLEAQKAVLEATIAWKSAMGEDVRPELKALEDLDKAWNKLNLSMGKVRITGTLVQHLFKQLGIDVRLQSGIMANAALLTAGAAAAMAQAWAAGGATVEQAALRMAAAVLQSIASYAFTKAIEQLALGFAAMSPVSPDFGHSGEHFTSAALWFAVGAATSIGAGLVSGAASGGNAGAHNEPQTQAAEGVQEGPTQQRNVPHLAGGALISQRSLVVLGDAAGSSTRSAREAAIPLDDPDALAQIGAAMGPHVQGSGGVTFIVQGLVSDDKLVNIVRRMNRLVKNKDVQLTATNAHKVTRKA